MCDSLIYNTKDSCLIMYKDPITWNANRQLLGEVIEVFMKDSTIDRAHVINQALSIEQLEDSLHFNQISSREMFGYFDNGEIRKTEAIGNVLAVYYLQDDKDSSLTNMAYIETDTMRMFMRNRQLETLWTCKSQNVMYPVTQTPVDKSKLPSFAWFDYIRPVDKDDIFRWRGKKSGTELKNIPRRSAPLQRISSGTVVSVESDLQPADGVKASTSDVQSKAEMPVDTKSGDSGGVNTNSPETSKDKDASSDKASTVAVADKTGSHNTGESGTAVDDNKNK